MEEEHLMSAAEGPEQSMLDAFDLIGLVPSGADRLFEAARTKAATYSEPGDLAAGVASVAAMVLDVLASLTDRSSAELLEQIHGQLGDVLLERNE
jgi:hypothetical protein